MTDAIQNTERKFPSQAKWRENNPQKVWAQAALRSALKRGLVDQKPCCVCGSVESEAHHANYDMPMVVEWYCRLHHKAEHARLKAEAVDCQTASKVDPGSASNFDPLGVARCGERPTGWSWSGLRSPVGRVV